MDVVDALVVPSTDRVDLGIEVPEKVSIRNQIALWHKMGTTYAASRACSNIQLTSLTATRRFFISAICVGATGAFVW